MLSMIQCLNCPFVMKSREIMALEESLGHHFQRRELLEQALTHSSQAREVEALGAGSGSSSVRFV